MKKLFGRDKPKMARVTPVSRELATGLASTAPESQYHSQHPPGIRSATSQSREGDHTLRRSSSEDHWEVVTPPVDPTSDNPYPSAQVVSNASSVASLPPGASPPIHSPTTRSSSPFSALSNSHPASHRTGARDRERDTSTLTKKPPSSTVAALGVLKALDPQSGATSQRRSRSEEHPAFSEGVAKEDKKEKRAFWDRSHTREKERDRDKRDDVSSEELMRMIGYLTATASEDWALVLEVCDMASANEANAREAVRALRREFKYGPPQSQLSAARLWAIMLRNSSETFISQSTSRKFLDTIEDILMSSRTSPVVRERLIYIVGAAAFASGSKNKDYRNDRDGFRGLWRRVKPVDKPDIGMPFDIDDAMFIPPASFRVPRSSNEIYPNQEQTPVSAGLPPPTSTPRNQKTAYSRDRIIPLEEDMRRLFQECIIGQGNASLLSEALTFAKPEDLTRKELIREFYLKCCSSQELIFAQIPWASAGAERSRSNKGRPGSDESPPEVTREEQLLAELLAANEALLEALRVYNDLERVAIERQAQERSKKDTRMNRADLRYEMEGYVHGDSPSAGVSSVSSRPLSPSTSSIQSDFITSITPSVPRLPPDSAAITQSLAPPPPAPHGPRSPGQMSMSSRAPSPVVPSRPSSPYSSENDDLSDVDRDTISNSRSGDGVYVNVYEQPSAKALGKRKVTEVDDPDPSEEVFDEPKDGSYVSMDRRYSDAEHPDGPWRHHVQYVYDAAAERTQQRIREGQLVGLVNGVH